MALLESPIESVPESLIQPLDEANRQLLSHVRPGDWRNPAPRGLYDLIVIGAGTAGLVSAAGAAGLGARVALIERGLMGGDCLNSGCVPSKALLRSARAVGEARRAASLGVGNGGAVDVDFGRVMTRMRRLRAGIGPHDSARRFTDLGIDVFFGEARFTGRRTVAVGEIELRFSRAVIATGGRPTAPPIPGLAEAGYRTNEDIFWLTERPSRLLLIGAGPIGCELAQAFARFGSEVTVLDIAPQPLPREDADAAALVRQAMEADGVRFELSVRPAGVSRQGGVRRISYEKEGVSYEAVGDELLVAAGRAPNVERLNLDAAGVTADKTGVVVNARLQTSNRRVYAAGDVCSVYKFTHAADAMARIVIQNALFFGRRKADALVIPWCTYTDPEIAHVGWYEQEAREKGRRVETVTIALSEVDRAILDGSTDGFVRVHHEKGRLLGCTIVAPHAGDLIGEASYVMTHGGSLANLSATVHPYPTTAEALRKAGDAYRRSLLTPSLRAWFGRYFRWTRW